MTTEEMLLQLIEGQKQLADDLSSFKNEVNNRFEQMDNRFDKMDNRFDKIEDELEELKEHAHITRSATNALIGKVEDFVSAYNELHSPEFKF